MATHPLNDQFGAARTSIELGTRRAVAIAAHLEIRAVLRSSPLLRARELGDVLIGSYARRTAIWPGKDVDVFGKLMKESIDSITPGDAFDLFHEVLLEAFEGRVEPQARSIKVNYRPGRAPAKQFLVEAAAVLKEALVPDEGDTFEFSVDVVPAVHFGTHWGIPNRNTQTWQRQAAADRWCLTDPEKLTELTRQLNASKSIGVQGVYVPTVKAVRQIRRAHLGDAKPGGFFIELLVYEGTRLGQIGGDTWADVTASALDYIADRLLTVAATPLCDPALDQPYAPLPDSIALMHAATVFAQLTTKARHALSADMCASAALWREVFGSNTKANGPIFPIPPGCTATGGAMPVFATPRVDPLRGSNEARGFGNG